jgi:transcriptional regulator with XRE-family HTH domain
MTSPGEKIKYLRQLVGMSQEELGRRVGVQRAAINKYEKGSVTNIPIATIEKIAKVFDVSPTYLVGWNDCQSNPLAVEVKLLQGITKCYGRDVVQLIEEYITLDQVGKKRVHQYMGDMNIIYAVDEINV